MILTDTGPLVALLDKDDPSHSLCAAMAKHLPSDAMLTTWIGVGSYPRWSGFVTLSGTFDNW